MIEEHAALVGFQRDFAVFTAEDARLCLRLVLLALLTLRQPIGQDGEHPDMMGGNDDLPFAEVLLDQVVQRRYGHEDIVVVEA